MTMWLLVLLTLTGEPRIMGEFYSEQGCRQVAEQRGDVYMCIRSNNDGRN